MDAVSFDKFELNINDKRAQLFNPASDPDVNIKSILNPANMKALINAGKATSCPLKNCENQKESSSSENNAKKISLAQFDEIVKIAGKPYLS